jgi:hypothetical protein
MFASLAYVEIRLKLARLLFSFDIEPTRSMKGWIDLNVFLLWQKKPLFIKLRKRDAKLRP